MRSISRRAIAASILCALVSSASARSDRAAFESSVATFASMVSGPNPITYLVTGGDFYCQMKIQRGGGPLDVYAAEAELRRLHPEFIRPTADDLLALLAAMQTANKLLCPD